MRHVRLRQLPALTAVAGTTTLAVATPSLATTVTVTGRITGGVLSVSTVGVRSFHAPTTSRDSTPTYTIPLGIQDTRGAGNGWSETITSTQFTTAGGDCALPTTASTLIGIVDTDSTATNTIPSNRITYPVAIPAGATPPNAVTVFTAAANTGMGNFTMIPTIAVFVPEQTCKARYTSSLTLALISGP